MFPHALVVALGTVMSGGPDTVVVSAPEYLDALRPWLAYRANQGHQFAFVSNKGTCEQIRGAIRAQAREGNLRFILLVGDAEPAALFDSRIRARCVPAYMVSATVNVRYRSTPEIATDNWYADLDDDHVPDVAIGRLTADSPDELATMVGKIMAYESSRRGGAWCQRINFVAGVGGFGPLVDPIIELATKKFLTDGIPAEYATSMTYGNWRSPYCPSPNSFHQATVSRLNEGCLFWVYIGHGFPYQLDQIRVPGESYPILSTADMPKLDSRHGAPIAVFLACYTGAYDQPYDCLAEQMLRAPGGPVAVLAGSRVMMPYAMAVLGSGLMDEYFRQQPATLGEIILHAKKGLVNDEARDWNRRLLDVLGAAMSPDPKLLAEERREHLSLFNLFGDPLMRMYYPRKVELDVAAEAEAGSYLEIRGQSELTGRCTIELVCRRDRLREQPPTRRKYDNSPTSQAAFNAAYTNANDRRWTFREIEINDGTFLTAIKIPQSARGACHVRAFLENGEEYALGVRDITILPPKDDSLPAHASLEDRPPEQTASGRVTDTHR